MSNQGIPSIEELREKHSSLLEPPPTGSRFLLLVGGILVTLLLCVGLTLLNQYGPKLPQAGPAPVATTSSATSLLASDTVSKSGVLYLALTGEGDRIDIFRYDPSAAAPVNLTRSAGVAEVWPVVSPNGARLAYYGIGANGVAELYVLTLPDGLGQPVTVRTASTPLHDGFDVDTSQPALWSLDGSWLAFLARQTDKKGDAVDLYVVRSDGSSLRRVTQNGNRILNIVWLSDDEVAYVEIRGDGNGTAYTQKLEPPPGVPTPVATLEAPR